MTRSEQLHRLAQAMRDGAERTDPIERVLLWSNDSSPDRPLACALGAAAVGTVGLEKKVERTLGFSTGNRYPMPCDDDWTSMHGKLMTEMYLKYPVLMEEVPPPLELQRKLDVMGSGTRAVLESVIVHLNDSCKWTREKIADYIDCLAER